MHFKSLISIVCICSANLLVTCDEQSAYWLAQQLLAPPPSPHVDPWLHSAGCSFFFFLEKKDIKSCPCSSPPPRYNSHYPGRFSSPLLLVIPSGIWKMLPVSWLALGYSLKASLIQLLPKQEVCFCCFSYLYICACAERILCLGNRNLW